MPRLPISSEALSPSLFTKLIKGFIPQPALRAATETWLTMYGYRMLDFKRKLDFVVDEAESEGRNIVFKCDDSSMMIGRSWRMRLNI